jgi:hypothetical protein
MVPTPFDGAAGLAVVLFGVPVFHAWSVPPGWMTRFTKTRGHHRRIRESRL